MTGEELFQELNKIPIEERKILKVYKSSWHNSGEENESGWESIEEIYCLTKSPIYDYSSKKSSKKDVDGIVLK